MRGEGRHEKREPQVKHEHQCQNTEECQPVDTWHHPIPGDGDEEDHRHDGGQRIDEIPDRKGKDESRTWEGEGANEALSAPNDVTRGCETALNRREHDRSHEEISEEVVDAAAGGKKNPEHHQVHRGINEGFDEQPYSAKNRAAHRLEGLAARFLDDEMTEAPQLADIPCQPGPVSDFSQLQSFDVPHAPPRQPWKGEFVLTSSGHCILA